MRPNGEENVPQSHPTSGSDPLQPLKRKALDPEVILRDSGNALRQRRRHMKRKGEVAWRK